MMKRNDLTLICERNNHASLSQRERGTASAVERVAKVGRDDIDDCNGEGTQRLTISFALTIQ